MDDQWWLAAGPAALPLRPLAAVALVPAAKILLGRPWPVPSRPADQEREGWRPFD